MLYTDDGYRFVYVTLKCHRNITTVHRHNFIPCTVPDCGVCSWPWQRFALGTADSPLFVTNNRCRPIPVTNMLGWSTVVFCACENTYFLWCSVRLELYINLTSVLLQTKHLNEQWTVFALKKTTPSSDTYVFGRVYMFCPNRRLRVLNGWVWGKRWPYWLASVQWRSF